MIKTERVFINTHSFDKLVIRVSEDRQLTAKIQNYNELWFTIAKITLKFNGLKNCRKADNTFSLIYNSKNVEPD